MDQRPAPTPATTPNWASGTQRRIPFYLLAALLLAALAGGVTFLYLERLRAEALPSATALVAISDIPVGTLLSESMVETRHVPKAILPVGSLTAPRDAIGRRAVVPIAAGEVLLPGKLSGGPQAALSNRLRDGRWAMVLPGAWLASPLPELIVGDRIDLLAYQPGQPVSEAALIVQGVEVLQFEAEHLTLAVNLEEASGIVYGRANGFVLLPLLRAAGG
jgi:Flp pilus assembly protein CpaB